MPSPMTIPIWIMPSTCAPMPHFLKLVKYVVIGLVCLLIFMAVVLL